MTSQPYWLRALLVLLPLVVALSSCTPQESAPPADGDASAVIEEGAAVPVDAPATTAPTAEAMAPDEATTDDAGPTAEIVAEGEIVPLEASDHPLVSQPAPELAMKRLSTGEDVRLADYAGRPVVVNFWATWCVPCRAEMPWLQATRDKFSDRGLEVLAVDAGERVPPEMIETQIQRFVNSMGLTLPVLYGDNTYDVQAEWTVSALPVSFLVTPDGVIADVRRGGYPNHATLEDHVQRVLLGGP